MKIRPETLIDGYKVDHRRQYPEGTELIVSNYTARGTRREDTNKVVFFGLQYFLKEYLINIWNREFFQKPEDEVAERFARRIRNYVGPQAAEQIGTDHIRALHKLGYLPVKVLALAEGTEYKLRIPSVVIYNTKKEFYWITNYLETIFSTLVWGPCTSATTAHQYKKLLKKFALDTVGNADFVPWQGHDFSFRGMFGLEAAVMSGGAHLISFTGTDTIPAIDWLEDYYNADSDKELIGGSVAATEHSVACTTILNFVKKVRIENAGTKSEIQIHDERMNLADIEYVRHLIVDLYPEGIVSIVSDSFDYWNTITNTAKVLRDVILARNGKVVFRPDTGDPVKVVVGEAWVAKDLNFLTLQTAMTHDYDYVKCGDKFYSIWEDGDADGTPRYKEVPATPELKGSIECLWDIFGGTETDKGYKLLNAKVGLIYGDSITLKRAKAICKGLKEKRFASINIVFGIGSFTYQYVTRDTDGNAIKATFSIINGTPVPIYKKPKTGDGLKNSAFGLVAVYKDDAGELYLKDNVTWEEMHNCEFIEVFEDGKMKKDWSLAEVRANLANYA